jgi:hypothetical protein
MGSPGIATAGTTRYALDEPSEFQDGCQNACECPVSILALRGTFHLAPVGNQDGFEVFDVADVQWVIQSDFQEDTVVAGSGALRIRPELQRLELDLSMGGGEPVHFDSGLVPVTATWPAIEVAIARNGFFCYDNVFALSARPEAPVAVSPSTWGRIKASYGP